MAVKRGRRIVWMDEVQFASPVVQMHEWSPAGIHYQYHKADLKIKVVKLILGVSKEREVEAYHFCDKLCYAAVVQWLNKVDVK